MGPGTTCCVVLLVALLAEGALVPLVFAQPQPLLNGDADASGTHPGMPLAQMSILSSSRLSSATSAGPDDAHLSAAKSTASASSRPRLQKVLQEVEKQVVGAPKEHFLMYHHTLWVPRDQTHVPSTAIPTSAGVPSTTARAAPAAAPRTLDAPSVVRRAVERTMSEIKQRGVSHPQAFDTSKVDGLIDNAIDEALKKSGMHVELNHDDPRPHNQTTHSLHRLIRSEVRSAVAAEHARHSKSPSRPPSHQSSSQPSPKTPPPSRHIAPLQIDPLPLVKWARSITQAPTALSSASIARIVEAAVVRAIKLQATVVPTAAPIDVETAIDAAVTRALSKMKAAMTTAPLLGIDATAAALTHTFAKIRSRNEMAATDQSSSSSSSSSSLAAQHKRFGMAKGQGKGKANGPMRLPIQMPAFRQVGIPSGFMIRRTPPSVVPIAAPVAPRFPVTITHPDIKQREPSQPSSQPATMAHLVEAAVIRAFKRLPTVTPSQLPTAMPTAVPSTAVPTELPSLPPSQSPSLAPSRMPSSAPSSPAPIPPTFDPTATPTLAPTILPTLRPTRTPTLLPSLAPGGATGMISALPSAIPLAAQAGIALPVVASGPVVTQQNSLARQPDALPPPHTPTQPLQVEPSVLSPPPTPIQPVRVEATLHWSNRHAKVCPPDCPPGDAAVSLRAQPQPMNKLSSSPPSLPPSHSSPPSLPPSVLTPASPSPLLPLAAPFVAAVDPAVELSTTHTSKLATASSSKLHTGSVPAWLGRLRSEVRRTLKD